MVTMSDVCVLCTQSYLLKSYQQKTHTTSYWGSTTDISSLLRFNFWERAYYKEDDSDFSSDSRESLGHMVKIVKNVRHALTYKVLTDKKQVIYCGNS